MAKVDTQSISLAYSIESALGTAGTTWFLLEPEDITAYGATITTVPRDPISKDRQRRKGTTTDLDSSVEFEHDMTHELVAALGEVFFFAEAVNYDCVFRAADVTANGYTIPAASAAQGAKFQWVTGEEATLVFAQGYANAINNGLKPLTADLATSGTELTVSAAGLTVETAPTNALVELAGMRFASGDLVLDVLTATTGTLTSTDVADVTTIGLTVGQWFRIGGLTATEQYAGGIGYARVSALSGSVITYEELRTVSGTLVDETPANAIDLLYGRFIRNVDVDADAEGNRFLERSLHFEVAYPNLGSPSTENYEYAAGNLGNSLGFNLPLTDKATMSVGMIGTTTEAITSTRKSGASTPILPLRTTAFNTSSDIIALETDQVAVADTCFKSFTATIGNAVSPDKCLGRLGAVFMNRGKFTVDLEMQLLFTDPALSNAIRNNTTAKLVLGMNNDNGAVFLDVPSLTFGGGAREFPRDQGVLINATGTAFKDATLGYSASLSLIPAVA